MLFEVNALMLGKPFAYWKNSRLILLYLLDPRLFTRRLHAVHPHLLHTQVGKILQTSFLATSLHKGV